MAKPTVNEIADAIVGPYVGSSRLAAVHNIMALVDAWEAEGEAERERGRNALALVETYGLRHHSLCLWHHGKKCGCGLDEALAALRDPDVARPSGRGAALRSPLSGRVLMNEGGGPTTSADDPAVWEYAEEEEVEQFNALQRARREAYAAALDAASCSGREVNVRAAAARYPLKKRVPATVDDPHGAVLWRGCGDVFEVSFHGGSEGSWKLAGSGTRNLAWTADRVRALAKLLDSPWMYADSTEVEEVPSDG